MNLSSKTIRLTLSLPLIHYKITVPYFYSSYFAILASIFHFPKLNVECPTIFLGSTSYFSSEGSSIGGGGGGGVGGGEGGFYSFTTIV